jgi:hypothetical protein
MDSPYRLLFFLVLMMPSVLLAAENINLHSSTSQSSDGSFNLSWTLPENKQIQLQHSLPNQSDYTTIYQGSDSASVITGLSDGQYRYRARWVNAEKDFSDWTDPLTVTVKHHSLFKAFGFFLVGAVVFLGILMLIVFASRSGRSGAGS